VSLLRGADDFAHDAVAGEFWRGRPNCFFRKGNLS